MAKKVKMIINGKIKYIPEAAVSLAQRFYGAAPVGAAKEIPAELTQPLIKPKLGKPIELKKPEIKLPEPIVEEKVIEKEIAPDPITSEEAPVTNPNETGNVERKKPTRSRSKK